MNTLSSWVICEELSVVQAALLMAGHDPSELQHHVENSIKPFNYRSPSGYEAAKTVITNAIESNKLPAKIRRHILGAYYDHSSQSDNVMASLSQALGTPMLIYPPNWMLTTIMRKDLCQWLGIQGITNHFFNASNQNNEATYLDPHNPYYSSKLAAVIQAWQAVIANPHLLKNKSPKTALMNWLREHCLELNLTKPDGTPNEQGIEEVAKIANWQQKGGAPGTPSF